MGFHWVPKLDRIKFLLSIHTATSIAKTLGDNTMQALQNKYFNSLEAYKQGNEGSSSAIAVGFFTNRKWFGDVDINFGDSKKLRDANKTEKQI